MMAGIMSFYQHQLSTRIYLLYRWMKGRLLKVWNKPYVYKQRTLLWVSKVGDDIICFFVLLQGIEYAIYSGTKYYQLF